jgi:hypothetical protein
MKLRAINVKKAQANMLVKQERVELKEQLREIEKEIDQSIANGDIWIDMVPKSTRTRVKLAVKEILRRNGYTVQTRAVDDENKQPTDEENKREKWLIDWENPVKMRLTMENAMDVHQQVRLGR